MNCSSSTVAPPALMAAPRLHRLQHYFSSHSFPSPYNPRSLKHHSFISPKPPPQNPSKTSISASFSTLRISFQNNRKSRKYFASASQIPDSQQHTHENKRLEEAREAIREYLEQLGASRDDASHICSNCSKYLQMLIDGVDDLDDWNSWSAASPGEEIIEDAVEFKNKVYQMAKQKGDNGVIPFLESLGLSLSSATRLARYLSSSGSNSLPLLVQKVKYLKEILFSDRDDHELIGKNARRMMAHLSISADEDVQQTLAFFEKIQARRGGLNLLGSEDTSFQYLVESFPRLLSMRIESRVKPVVKYLEDIGVPKEHIRNIFLLFPPVISYDIEKDIKPKLQSFEKIGAKDDLGKMLVKYPWIISASILENFEKILVFFNDEKVPKVCSSHAIKNWPHILGCSVNKMKLMVEQLEDMDIKNKKLGQVIAASPQLLLRKPQEFAQVVSFFKDLGLDDEAIARTLVRCPEIFATSIDKTLEKKLDFLSKVGVSKPHLPRVIRKYPELFVCDVDKALLPRVRYLMGNGLSKNNIGSMLRRFSPLLGYSIEEVLRPKLEFLVRTMGKPVSEVVDYPRYFSYSLEKKIKPRYWVLKSRSIEFTLKEMLGKNDEEFADEYL
ncbi:hypothetical protein PHJA_002049700 [Phtheirospermum japonicum]|uniref:Mitochondrial transcription termination factor n=1 Tax=Phtheirospermum japonicum TaxID=374723 RepID=A0A830CNQ4_9LAMI|nr:hypothetical protein PHJA_002049700 [Phtheirospermum japonicum]